MTWIETYGQTAMACDHCHDAELSVSRDEFTPEEWTTGKDKRDLADRAQHAGWSLSGQVHWCPDCG